MSMFTIGRKGYKWILRNVFITVIFALLYFIADEVTVHSENIQKRFGKTKKKPLIEYLYFSLVTQTTLGATIFNKSITGISNTFDANEITRYINMLQLVGILLVAAIELD